MIRTYLLLALACLPLLFSGVVSADIFKYVDRTGHIHYTDSPRHSGFRLIIKTPPTLILSSRKSSPAAGVRQIFRNSQTARKSRKEFDQIIAAAADKYNLDPALLHAVIRAESGYNPGAVSNKGAAGLMQLMPGTASRYGVRDRFDPVENVEGGARYLSDLLDMFPSDLRLAVAAYNSGENTVKKFGYQIPPIPETQQYVGRVLNYYRR